MSQQEGCCAAQLQTKSQQQTLTGQGNKGAVGCIGHGTHKGGLAAPRRAMQEHTRRSLHMQPCKRVWVAQRPLYSLSMRGGVGGGGATEATTRTNAQLVISTDATPYLLQSVLHLLLATNVVPGCAGDAGRNSPQCRGLNLACCVLQVVVRHAGLPRLLSGALALPGHHAQRCFAAQRRNVSSNISASTTQSR